MGLKTLKETQPVVFENFPDKVLPKVENHFNIMPEARGYGYSDKVAIITAIVWANLLRESLLESDLTTIHETFPAMRKFRDKLFGLTQIGKWQIGRKLGEIQEGEKVCLVPHYDLYDFSESNDEWLNPSFQRVRVVSNKGRAQVQCVSLSKVWKFAGLDGNTGHFDLKRFGEHYDSKTLQLVGKSPEKEYFFESSGSTIIIPAILE